MASVKVSHEWADGETTTVVVTVQTSYPDALSEARATARQAFAEVIAEVRMLVGEDEEPD